MSGLGVYGKARYSQIRRYSQIQNGLARPFNRTREGGFCTLAFNEKGPSRRTPFI